MPNTNHSKTLDTNIQTKFVHLHLHTQYSFLDGAINIKKLAKRLNEMGMEACAITDHGTMYGVIDFYKTMKNAGIKPIIGCEVYISPDSRTKTNYLRGEKHSYHMGLLAENSDGLINLQKLATIAQLEGFYYKPRIDREVLKQHAKGLIGLSGCLGGEVPQHLLNNNYDAALQCAKDFNEILGDGNYFLEMQDNGIPEQYEVNEQIVRISQETGIPLVATNDAHFLDKDDHDSHNVLVCIQTGSKINDPNKMEAHSTELYVKSPQEMYNSFGSTHPQALENTIAIAQRCTVDFTFGNLHLPAFPTPDNSSQEDFFLQVATQGLENIFSNDNIPPEIHQKYRDRLKFEADIIRDKGFVGYFLIVWDFVKWSKENGVVVGPGRGSGAGSLIAYSMGITEVDPIKFGLLFERFLNPERTSMPDFDIDFCIEGRDRVIQYVYNKYGNENVTQIVTFSKLLAKGIIRDVGRVLDVPLPVVNKLSKKIPVAPGMTLVRALEDVPNLEDDFLAEEHGDELLKHSLKLEGLFRQAGTHAAGVLIADKPLVEYCPLTKIRSSASSSNILADMAASQYEKDTAESIGLIKFDFLGLANLTNIDVAAKLIQKHTPNFNIANIPFDDKKTYDLMTKGDTSGVFQLESEGMRQLLRKLKPTHINDIVAVVALYRPGPIGSGMLDSYVRRKHGQEEATYYLPELKEFLEETYGIIVYQEQVMQVAQRLAGYSLGAADLLRRAMGKKKAEEMAKQREMFIHGNSELNIDGAIKLGFDPQLSNEIFDLMEKFAEYGFNKSHSAAYGIIAYQTAYLKANYSVEYMTALLSVAINNSDRIAYFIAACKPMGINVLPPNVNKSQAQFSALNGNIVFGLAGIKGIGMDSVTNIENERNENGDFTSFMDFLNRIDNKKVNKKGVESLIKAGSFDWTGKKRKQLLNALPDAMKEAQGRNNNLKNLGSSLDMLFAMDDDNSDNNLNNDNNEQTRGFIDHFNYGDDVEFSRIELLLKEKESLGIYLTGHPLGEYLPILDKVATPIKQLGNINVGTHVGIAGIITEVKNTFTRKDKKPMAIIKIEDVATELTMPIFPGLFQAVEQLMVMDTLIFINGEVSTNDDLPTLKPNAIYPLQEGIIQNTRHLTLTINISQNNELKLKNTLNEINNLLANNKGRTKVLLRVAKDIPNNKQPKALLATQTLTQKVNISPKLITTLADILEPHNVTLTPNANTNPNKKQQTRNF